MSVRTYRSVESPLGGLTFWGHDGVLRGLFMADQRYAPAHDGWREDPNGFAQAVEQIGGYFAGERRTFDFPMETGGTPFRRLVYDALVHIPYGETRSYGQLATDLGCPGAARAVGHANGHNPIAIVVPCHRLVGSTGALTGYGGGLERKRWLLEHERAVAAGNGDHAGDG